MKKLLFLMVIGLVVNLNALTKPSVSAESSEIAKYLVSMTEKAKSYEEVAKNLKLYLIESENLAKSAKMLFYQVNYMRDQAKKKALKRKLYLHEEVPGPMAVLSGVEWNEMITWKLYKDQRAGGTFIVKKINEINKFEIRRPFY